MTHAIVESMMFVHTCGTNKANTLRYTDKRSRCKRQTECERKMEKISSRKSPSCTALPSLAGESWTTRGWKKTKKKKGQETSIET